MKKFFSYLFVIAAAATTFVACNKDDASKLPSQTKTVNFIAGAPTKTTFGTVSAGKYPTIWSGNESNVKVAQNISGGIDAAVTKVSDTQANFAATFSDDSTGSYTFYAVSPSSAVVSGINTTYYSWNLEIPTDQTPTTSGPDENAMIMVAMSETVSTFPTTVSLDFNHFTAYGKMSVTNLALDSGDEIASVLITASQKIAYRYYYYVSGANVGTSDDTNAQNSILIHTSSLSNIWFACAPLAAGTTFDLAVTTANSKVYTKSGIAIPAALEAGHIAEFSVNFSGIAAAPDKIYTLVTDYSQLTAGSEVIVASLGDADFAMGVVPAAGTYASAVAATKSADDQTITNPASTVDVFTLEAGSVANTVAFNGTNGYITSYTSSSNNVKATSTKDANSSFSVEIIDNTTGEISLIANGTYTVKDIRYNSSSTRFSLYTTTSTQAHPALYKLDGSGDDASTLILPQLDTPANLQAVINGSDITVSWDAVANADNYLVTCTGQTDQTLTTTSAVFSGLADGLYTITVTAISADHSVRLDSDAATTTATVGTVTATTWTHTFAKDDLKLTPATLSAKTWTYTVTNYDTTKDPYWGFDTNTTTQRGLQIGSSTNATTSFILKSTDFTGTISQIVINSSIASSGKAKFTISVGGNQYGTETSPTTAAADYTFNGSSTGEIVISYTNENTGKAFYIKSLSVTTN